MCAVCGGTGLKKAWARYGVATNTNPNNVLWANHVVLEPCQCQLWAWPNPIQPIYVTPPPRENTMTDITQADIARMKEAAEKVIASRQEAKDPLNKSGEVGQRVFDRKRFIADNEFFKLLDWHGEYGQPIDGPHKILALIAEREALREALKPFADEAAKYDLSKDDVFDTAWDSMFKVGALFVARAALGDKP